MEDYKEPKTRTEIKKNKRSYDSVFTSKHVRFMEANIERKAKKQKIQQE